MQLLRCTPRCGHRAALCSSSTHSPLGAPAPRMHCRNVYDAFNVWRTYKVGDPMPDVDDATFKAMQASLQQLLVCSPLGTKRPPSRPGGVLQRGR